MIICYHSKLLYYQRIDNKLMGKDKLFAKNENRKLKKRIEQAESKVEEGFPPMWYS